MTMATGSDSTHLETRAFSACTLAAVRKFTDHDDLEGQRDPADSTLG